jgi:hypothetical protein
MATEPIVIPDATAQPAQYKQALLDLIGDTDPIITLGSTVEKSALPRAVSQRSS